MRTSGLPERLRRWREEQGLSYRKFAEVLNEHLPESGQVSYVTLRDWEQEGSAGPRPEVLEALREAYPELRLGWLLFDEGPPREIEKALSEQLAESDEVELQAEGGEMKYRVPDWPTVQSLPLVARHVFIHLVAKLVHTATDLNELGEEQKQALIRKATLTVQNLLMIPLHSWGFQTPAEMDRNRYEAYSLAMLQALSLAVHPAARGESSGSFEGSLMDVIASELEERLLPTLINDEDGEE